MVVVEAYFWSHHTIAWLLGWIVFPVAIIADCLIEKSEVITPSALNLPDEMINVFRTSSVSRHLKKL